MRPRVSRACEWCRVKKAKCDGGKPCERCKLESRACMYKRRKLGLGRPNQRQTHLHIEHVDALVAGLLQLYGRVLENGLWPSPSVEDLNGEPSVHGILDRLGVLDRCEDAAGDGTSPPETKSESAPPSAAARSSPTSTAPKARRVVQPLLHAEAKCAHAPSTAPQHSFSSFPDSTSATNLSNTLSTFVPAPDTFQPNKASAQPTLFPQHPFPLTPSSYGGQNSGTTSPSWQNFSPVEIDRKRVKPVSVMSKSTPPFEAMQGFWCPVPPDQSPVPQIYSYPPWQSAIALSPPDSELSSEGNVMNQLKHAEPESFKWPGYGSDSNSMTALKNGVMESSNWPDDAGEHFIDSMQYTKFDTSL